MFLFDDEMNNDATPADASDNGDMGAATPMPESDDTANGDAVEEDAATEGTEPADENDAEDNGDEENDIPMVPGV